MYLNQIHSHPKSPIQCIHRGFDNLFLRAWKSSQKELTIFMWAIVVWHKMKPFPTDLKFRGRILSDLLTSKNSIDFLFHSIMASTEGTDSHRFPHNLIKETLANHFFISILLLGDIGVLTPQQSFNHKPQQLYMSIQLKRQWLGISLSIETSRDRSPVVLVRGLGYCVWVDEWVFTRDIERKKK